MTVLPPDGCDVFMARIPVRRTAEPARGSICPAIR